MGLAADVGIPPEELPPVYSALAEKLVHFQGLLALCACAGLKSLAAASDLYSLPRPLLETALVRVSGLFDFSLREEGGTLAAPRVPVEAL